jgi:hypothetical protein
LLGVCAYHRLHLEQHLLLQPLLEELRLLEELEEPHRLEERGEDHQVEPRLPPPEHEQAWR